VLVFSPGDELLVEAGQAFCRVGIFISSTSLLLLGDTIMASKRIINGEQLTDQRLGYESMEIDRRRTERAKGFDVFGEGEEYDQEVGTAYWEAQCNK